MARVCVPSPPIAQSPTVGDTPSQPSQPSKPTGDAAHDYNAPENQPPKKDGAVRV